MSNWTHVAGVVRIDDLRFDDETPDFDEMFGKELSYDSGDYDDYDKHPEQYMPCGSEGTLEKSVWINPKTNCLAAYTISIFGDFRDHDDTHSIVKWFSDKLNEISEDYIIRQATITVENEWCGTESWTFEYPKEEDR